MMTKKIIFEEKKERSKRKRYRKLRIIKGRTEKNEKQNLLIISDEDFSFSLKMRM